MTKRAKRPPGRPPKGDKTLMSPVMIRFPQAMVDDIDAIRAARRDEPDRSSIIRELIAEALEARARKK